MATRKVPDGKFKVAFSLAGEQRELVRKVALEVEKKLGRSTVFLDEWFEYYIAGHDADIRLQSIYAERCELAIVCVSANYDDKSWTQMEHAAIRARVMKARESMNETDDLGVLPIRVGDGEVRGIPFNTIVPDVRKMTVAKAAQLIVDRLELLVPQQPNNDPGDEEWPEVVPDLDWPMADHHDVRTAFASLLTQTSKCRFLPIKGPSETGKSNITRQMLYNALRLPSVYCGRFDFKGTTGMDGEVRTFADQLEIAPPPASHTLNERLTHLLGTLRDRPKPTLLILDTYEAAGEAEQWVERQLLISLIRSPWLRLVIAGQRIPQGIDPISCPAIELEIPPPEDWFEYAKQRGSDITLEEVRTACRLARNRATLLAQLLVPSQ